MALAEKDGLAPWFRHLGLIPFDDVLALNAAADAVLNPSLFEGWASSVEEAKSLGTPLILSDIDVHREQAPSAQFFSPRNPEALGARLIESSKTGARRQCDPKDLVAANSRRLEEFGNAFCLAAEAAANLGAPRGQQRPMGKDNP
jgi:glycosyltransferase involved in cell wall biosynthesis